jgi:site-specific recombinase XerD
MNKIELNGLMSAEMNRKDFAPRTKANYTTQIENLLKFFGNRDIEELTIDDIGQYISHLEQRRKLQEQSINVVIHGLTFVFNEVLNKDFDFSKLKYKRRKFLSVPDIFTTEEVIAILDNIENIKYKAMIALIYSSGLTLKQLLEIKKKDVDFDNYRIRIQPYSKRGKPYSSVLSETAAVIIRKYIAKHNPEKYLFEGVKAGKPYLSGRQIQAIFTDAMRKATIVRKASLMDLRHSYILHLRDFGYPVKQILEVSGAINTATYYRYATAHIEYTKELKSPLDIIKLQQNRQCVDTRVIRNLADRISDDDERNYFYEAIDCFGCGALRAGVIMVWIAAMRNIQMQCLKSIDLLNTAIVRHFPKARNVDTVEDFAYIRDDVILKAAHDLGRFDKNETAQLQECLTLRNQCAHPGNYSPGIHKVQSFVEVIIQMFYL